MTAKRTSKKPTRGGPKKVAAVSRRSRRALAEHAAKALSRQAPLGIILCAGKKRETVEYLDLDARGIHVAEYLTELPPREVLEDRLHRAIEAARRRLVLGAGADIDAAPLAPTPTTPDSKSKPKGRRK